MKSAKVMAGVVLIVAAVFGQEDDDGGDAGRPMRQAQTVVLARILKIEPVDATSRQFTVKVEETIKGRQNLSGQELRLLAALPPDDGPRLYESGKNAVFFLKMEKDGKPDKAFHMNEVLF